MTFGQAIFSYLDKYFNLENGWLDIFLGQTQSIAYLTLFAALIMFYYFCQMFEYLKFGMFP